MGRSNPFVTNRIFWAPVSAQSPPRRFLTVIKISRSTRLALAACVTVLLLALVPAAFAGKGGGGGGGKPSGGGGSCVRNAPSVSIDNNWSWSGNGTYGLPGQQLNYAVHVTNNDSGCGGSTFVINVTGPSGFSVSVPTSTISLNSPAAGYLFAYVTSPSGVVDGDYPVTASVQRTGASAPDASFTSWYKVYSSDSTAPTLFWPSPDAGAAITGRSYNVGVEANDDHSVQRIEVYIDNVLLLSKACDDISYNCQAAYTWSTKVGSHTATFKGYDWMGNVAVQTVNFTVS
jgi:hypothetical protein